MLGKQWCTFLKLVQEISAFFSITINSFLIFLIITKSPKQIGAYKYLMIFISVFEIFYSILDSYLAPQHYSHGPTFLVIVPTENKFLGPVGLNILNAIYWGFFGASMAVFGVHFVYRWLVVSDNPLLETFNDWRICLWLCIPLGYGTIWVFTGYVLCAPTDATTEFVRYKIKELFEMEYGTYVYLGPYWFERIEGRISLRAVPFLGLSIISVTITSSIIIVLVFGFLCYARINRLVLTTTASAKFQKLQKQLFYALVVQTLIPFVLMHIPACILVTFVFFDIELGVYSAVLSMTIGIYPAADPIPTLVIVESYRKTVLEWLGCLKPKKVGTTSTSQFNSNPTV